MAGDNITLDLDIEQKGHIKVDSKILDDLSSGIYSSPASCIKELINNSYDADAKEVFVRIKPLEESIVIIDDGVGMNAKDFDENFAWISRSNKRNLGELSSIFKRPLIGKIGIGFIAVNEICEELEVISTKKGEGIKFTANINFKQIKEKSNNTDDTRNTGIMKGKYTLINEVEDEDEHYTIIRLLHLKDSVKDILSGRTYYAEISLKNNINFGKEEFHNMLELINKEGEGTIKKLSEINDYARFIIDLATYVPVEYIDKGPIVGIGDDNIINNIINRHKNLDFTVDIDGIYLKKPIYFEYGNKTDFCSFEKEINIGSELLKFNGYFYIQHGILEPREFNGVSIKIRNVPIAEQFGFDTTFMGYPSHMNQLFRNWISGEIFVESGLEVAMNIDRKSFRITHPHYIELQKFLHEYLDKEVFPRAYKLYKISKDERSEQNKIIQEEEIKMIQNTTIEELLENISNEEEPIATPVPKKTLKKKSAKKNNIVKKNAEFDLKELDKIKPNFKKKDWDEYLKPIFLIFELSLKESSGDFDKLKHIFFQRVKNWKGK